MIINTVRLRGLYYLLVTLLIILAGGCSENPDDSTVDEPAIQPLSTPGARYFDLCSSIAKMERTIKSCNCLAREYDKILGDKEYETVNIMLERSIQELRKPDDALFELQGQASLDEIDQQAFMIAMGKIRSLQQKGICGYVPPTQ